MFRAPTTRGSKKVRTKNFGGSVIGRGHDGEEEIHWLRADEGGGEPKRANRGQDRVNIVDGEFICHHRGINRGKMGCLVFTCVSKDGAVHMSGVGGGGGCHNRLEGVRRQHLKLVQMSKSHYEQNMRQ